MFATTPLRLHPALVGRRIHPIHSCHVRWDSRASPLMQLQMGPFTMGFFPSLSKGNTALLIKSISTHATANGPLPWVFFLPAFQRATPHFRSRASPLMQPQMGLYHELFFSSLSKGNTALSIKSISTHAIANGPLPWAFFPSLSKGNTALSIKSISTHATANGPLPWAFFSLSKGNTALSKPIYIFISYF